MCVATLHDARLALCIRFVRPRARVKQATRRPPVGCDSNRISPFCDVAIPSVGITKDAKRHCDPRDAMVVLRHQNTSLPHLRGRQTVDSCLLHPLSSLPALLYQLFAL